ncbi:hypothetical protein LCGC14_3031350 [marine sediment metagenome]|uniref:Uncharacterized protein n=1 Tax=marine sediment metagenome TaxID=412755 RepID=A0A0F8WSN5_9ZZZZ
MKTTIQVSNNLREKLVKLKYKLKVKSLDDVIQRMYDLITKFKLEGEMK